MDLKNLGMTALIKLHNELATKLGVATESSFKSLGAARSAITTLETKMTQLENTAAEAAQTVDDVVLEDEVSDADAAAAMAAIAATVTAPPTSDVQKYNSTGKRGPNQGVGAYAKELILLGKNNADALKMVLARFPDAKTSSGCIAFYRTKLAKVPGGVNPEKLRADAEKLIAQATAIETARKEAGIAAAAKLAEAAAAAQAAVAAQEAAAAAAGQPA